MHVFGSGMAKYAAAGVSTCARLTLSSRRPWTKVVATWRRLVLRVESSQGVGGPGTREAYTPKEMGLPWGSVVKVLPLPNHCVGVAFFQPPNALHDAGLPPGTLPGTNTPALLLRCPAPDAAASLYALLWSRRDLMADPRGMPDPRDLESNPPGKGWVCAACTLANRPFSPQCEACGAAKQHPSSGSRSSGEGGSVGAVYVFGAANETTKMGLTKAEANYDERQLLEVSAALEGPSYVPLGSPLQKSFRCQPRCHLLVGLRRCLNWWFCFVSSPHVCFFVR
jgi:hypothetical protein